MKYAYVEGARSEPQPGLSGACLSCGAAMVAKCGEQRVWHWAHRGVRSCDPWWEPETEWHREWKNHFPTNWQEVVQFAANGEKHVADVKTQNGTVIEFQHSFLKVAERVARETCYRKMVWVVDGRRRVRDAAQLLKCIGRRVFHKPPYILYATNNEESALLRDWSASAVPVYFDLGPGDEGGNPVFWRLDPISRTGRIYLTPVSRESFLKVHLDGSDAETAFSEGVHVIDEGLRQAANLQMPARPLRYRGRRFPRL